MIVMKSRYEIADVHLKVINMSPRDADSYVLLKASDESGNEIAFALSNDQSERLEAELFEANRRRRFSAYSGSNQQREPETSTMPESFGNEEEQISH